MREQRLNSLVYGKQPSQNTSDGKARDAGDRKSNMH